MTRRIVLIGALCAGGTACTASPVPETTAACTPDVTPEVWVERRFPAAAAKDSTTKASLAIRIAPGDSAARLPPRSMISVLIAGPSAAQMPDTVRLITAEEPDGAPLWRGDQVRPGTYMASLTMQSYSAGPHELVIAPGERIELDVRMHHRTGCPVPGQ